MSDGERSWVDNAFDNIQDDIDDLRVEVGKIRDASALEVARLAAELEKQRGMVSALTDALGRLTAICNDHVTKTVRLTDIVKALEARVTAIEDAEESIDDAALDFMLDVPLPITVTATDASDEAEPTAESLLRDAGLMLDAAEMELEGVADTGVTRWARRLVELAREGIASDDWMQAENAAESFVWRTGPNLPSPSVRAMNEALSLMRRARYAGERKVVTQ